MAINATVPSRSLGVTAKRGIDAPSEASPASAPAAATQAIEPERTPASEEIVKGSRQIMQGLEKNRLQQMFEAPDLKEFGPQAGIRMTCGRGGKCS